MNIENSFVFHIFTVIKLRHYNCLNKITYTLVDNLYINKTCQTCCETFQALCQRKREEYIENNLLDTCSIKEIFISWRSIFFYFLFFVFFCLFAVFFLFWSYHRCLFIIVSFIVLWLLVVNGKIISFLKSYFMIYGLLRFTKLWCNKLVSA